MMHSKRGDHRRKSSSFFWCVLLLVWFTFLTACRGTGSEGPSGQSGQESGEPRQSTEEQKKPDESSVAEEPSVEEMTQEELEQILAEFDFPVQKERVHVKIPGMHGKKRLLYLSDLHLLLESDQIAQKDLGEVRARMAWSSYGDVSAAEAWPIWVEYLDCHQADGVLFGGDMVDFASKANTECLEKGLRRLKTPWLYVRADHDLAPYCLEGVFESESIGYQRELGGRRMEDVMAMEFEDFIVAGWNNSTGQLTQAGLERMKEIFQSGKSVILLTHVPIKPIVSSMDVSLADASREAWGGRVLLWGNRGTDCAYQPNEITQEFLNMVYDENTPVCEILCGHLHFSWDGQVTKRVHQHVFSAALERRMGEIEISGE